MLLQFTHELFVYSMEQMIDVSQLTKRYRDFVAVDGISFQVGTGEIFGILGPNGAGKTTTLEMMEGLKKITNGDALINGVSVKEHPLKVKQMIGVQLQSASFFDLMNLVELLEFFGSLYDHTIDALTLLEKVSLTDKAKNQARELSGGQRQRLSIAVALVNDPLVLFLDEPTTGLDPQARRHLWELIRSIQQEGKTIILTTHYMEEAETLCDRIAIMDSAHIIALDTPKGLLNRIDHTASISFHITNDLDPATFLHVQGVSSAVRIKDTVTLVTDTIQKTLIDLIAYDQQHTVDFTDLQVHESNLEDVFLALTGKHLRE